MAKKRHSVEQVVRKLREAEVELANGARVKECLERMIFFSEPSLRRAIAEFVHHYHGERNHQGLGNALIEAEGCVGSPHGKVQCRKRLGGLLSYYHRAAA